MCTNQLVFHHSLNFALTKAGRGTRYQIILIRMMAPGKAKLMAVLVTRSSIVSSSMVGLWYFSNR